MRLTDLLFPPRCVACGVLLDFEGLADDSALCEDCQKLLLDEQRERCGFCQSEVTQCTCMTELQKKAGCKGFFKAVYYRHGTRIPVQNKLIFRIKDKRDARTARILAGMLQSVLEGQDESRVLSGADTVIVYVPRRRSIVLQTGVDQAKALAKALSHYTGIPAVSCIVRRRGKQMEQKTLTQRERLKNARSSFSVRHPERIAGRNVLLVDDIVTTGASMAVCAKALLAAGGNAVYCVAVASDDTNKNPDVPQPSGAKKAAFGGKSFLK